MSTPSDRNTASRAGVASFARMVLLVGAVTALTEALFMLVLWPDALDPLRLSLDAAAAGLVAALAADLMFVRPLRRSLSAERDESRLRRALLEAVGQPVLVFDHLGTLRHANVAARDLLGLGDDQAGLLSTICPDLGGDAAAALRAESQATLAQPRILRTIDGVDLPALVRVCAVAQGSEHWWVMAAADLSAQRAEEADRVRQLNLLHALIEAIPAPIFYKNEDAVYLGCNRAFEAFIGMPAAEVVGKGVYDVAPEALADKYYKADRDLMDAGGTQIYETGVRFADGSEHDVMFHKAVYEKADGSAAGIVGVMLDITQRKAMEARLRHLSTHDSLTDLPNRQAFAAVLRSSISRARRTERQVALLLVDLDGFKPVNDAFGHDAGDALLIGVAGRFGDALRASDLLARLGGDEFTVLLDDCAGIEQAGLVADKLLASLAEPFALDAGQAVVGASIGVALFPEDADSPEDLIKVADAAMYVAKRRGRGRWARPETGDEPA